MHRMAKLQFEPLWLSNSILTQRMSSEKKIRRQYFLRSFFRAFVFERCRHACTTHSNNQPNSLHSHIFCPAQEAMSWWRFFLAAALFFLFFCFFFSHVSLLSGCVGHVDERRLSLGEHFVLDHLRHFISLSTRWTFAHRIDRTGEVWAQIAFGECKKRNVFFSAWENENFASSYIRWNENSKKKKNQRNILK